MLSAGLAVKNYTLQYQLQAIGNCIDCTSIHAVATSASRLAHSDLLLMDTKSGGQFRARYPIHISRFLECYLVVFAVGSIQGNRIWGLTSDHFIDYNSLPRVRATKLLGRDYGVGPRSRQPHEKTGVPSKDTLPRHRSLAHYRAVHTSRAAVHTRNSS